MSHTPDAMTPSRSQRRSLIHTGHAVVIGGGIAGLLTARVLTDHFKQVTLVERDGLPDEVAGRKGVPQGRLLHVLLPRGREIVERLFPGYRHDLEAAGAVSLRLPADALILNPAGWLDRRATGWPLISASRPLFEGMIRRRLRELPGVTILDRHDATGLLTSREGRVTGVALRPCGAAGGGSQQLAADLVVDACGRGSRAPAWLSEARYPVPARTQVDAPTDEDGFTAFTRSLRHQVIANALSLAEPARRIHGFRGTANRVWHLTGKELSCVY